MDYYQIMNLTPTRELITCDIDTRSFEEFVETIPNELLKYRVKRWSKKWVDFLWAEYRFFKEWFDDEMEVSYDTFCRLSYISLLMNIDREKTIRREIQQMTM